MKKTYRQVVHRAVNVRTVPHLARVLPDKHDAEASKYRDPFKSETRNRIKNLREAFKTVKDTYKTMILVAYQDMKNRIKN